jgi:shikimate kinase
MANQNHIYLLGQMGSGKTKLGKQLATKLGLPFVDLDRYIEKQTRQTIASLFEKQGEEYFRAVENQYLKEVADKPSSVISLGGGTPCYFSNMEIVKQTGRSIYLQTPIPILVSRLKESTSSRPLISGKTEEELKAFLQQQLQVRESFYLLADYVVDNDGKLKVTDLVSLLG